MIDWTGERFVPWVREPAVAYEHLHRYMWAATLVKGKRVLDLACGEGYGSALLARAAASVVGIDIDGEAVAHAVAKYTQENLQFLQGSILATGIEADHSFDFVVCFEAIEHIEAHADLLREVKRLLKPDGTFVVSTPNKDVYNSSEEDGNPFHVKELSFTEFDALLRTSFSSLAFLGQRIYPASSLWPIENGDHEAIREFVIERGESEFQMATGRTAEYFIALASDRPIDKPEGSVLLDRSNELVTAKNAEIEEVIAEATEARLWFESQLRSRDEALNWQKSRVTELEESVEWTKTQNDNLALTVKARDEALEWRAAQLDDHAKGRAAAESQLADTQQLLATVEHTLAVTKAELDVTNHELRDIQQHPVWRGVLKLRNLRRKIGF